MKRTADDGFGCDRKYAEDWFKRSGEKLVPTLISIKGDIERRMAPFLPLIFPLPFMSSISSLRVQRVENKEQLRVQMLTQNRRGQIKKLRPVSTSPHSVRPVPTTTPLIRLTRILLTSRNPIPDRDRRRRPQDLPLKEICLPRGKGDLQKAFSHSRSRGRICWLCWGSEFQGGEIQLLEGM